MNCLFKLLKYLDFKIERKEKSKITEKCVSTLHMNCMQTHPAQMWLVRRRQVVMSCLLFWTNNLFFMVMNLGKFWFGSLRHRLASLLKFLRSCSHLTTTTCSQLGEACASSHHLKKEMGHVLVQRHRIDFMVQDRGERSVFDVHRML